MALCKLDAGLDLVGQLGWAELGQGLAAGLGLGCVCRVVLGRSGSGMERVETELWAGLGLAGLGSSNASIVVYQHLLM